jgi:hypothetical protein
MSMVVDSLVDGLVQSPRRTLSGLFSDQVVMSLCKKVWYY